MRFVPNGTIRSSRVHSHSYVGDCGKLFFCEPLPTGRVRRGWHWLRVDRAAGRAGRLEFTGGTASFFAAGFSTKESLNVAAYDRRGRRIASQALRSNENIGWLDTVRLKAP